MRLLCFIIFSTQFAFAQLPDDLIPYRSGDKWGYSTRNKDLIIKPMYDYATQFYQNLAVVVKDKESAVIDKNNKVILPFTKQRLFALGDNIFINEIEQDSSSLMGVIDIHNKIIVPAEYESIDPVYDILEVRKNKKCGTISYEGKILIPPVYDEINYIKNKKFYFITKDSLRALFNSNGTQLTEFKYMFTDEFKNGLSLIRTNDHYGFIDEYGKEIIPPIYESANAFSNGYAVVKKEKYGIIDTLGRYQIPLKYHYLEEIYPGVAAAHNNDKWALVDFSRKELTPFEFDELRGMYNNTIIVQKNGKWALLSSKGKVLTPFEFDGVEFNEFRGSNIREYLSREFKENQGNVPVIKNEKWGLIDVKGKTILNAEFDYMIPFTNTLAIAKKGSGWALVDTKGNFKTDFSYNSLQPFISRANLFIIHYQKDGLFGLMNTDGKELTAPVYDYISPIYESYCTVSQNRKIGLVDIQGNVIFTAKYDKILADFAPGSNRRSIFNNNLCLVRINGKMGYVSKEGVEYFE